MSTTQEVKAENARRARDWYKAAKSDPAFVEKHNRTRRDWYTAKRLHVDHDHSTGKVRGLLCRKCNVAIGLLDSQKLLERAAFYLTEPSPLENL